MRVIKIDDVKAKENSAPLFEGGKVYDQTLVESTTSKVPLVAVMNFSAGAMTKSHTHDCEQVLYVLSGKGRVATDNEEHIVLPGTVVYIPRGEPHRHGATEDSPFVQLTVTNSGPI